MIGAAAQKRRAGAGRLRQIESDHVGIKTHRALQVGHIQGHIAQLAVAKRDHGEWP